MYLAEAAEKLALLKPGTEILFVGRLAVPTLLGLGRVTVGHQHMAEALQLDPEMLKELFAAGIALYNLKRSSFTVVGDSTSFPKSKIDSAGLTNLAQTAEIRLFEIPFSPDYSKYLST